SPPLRRHPPSLSSLSLHGSVTLLDPPSFPTRRSSDLYPGIIGQCRAQGRDRGGVLHRRRRIHRKRNEADYKQSQRGTSDYCGDKDRKSTRLNSSHSQISYAVFCLKKKKKQQKTTNEYV